MPEKVTTVADYLASFPPEVQEILDEARGAVRQAASGAEEAISYQIIAFKVNGRPMVYLGGWKNHVGLYPIPVLDHELEERVAPYRAAKDTLRFPLRKPIPYDLISHIVAQLVVRQQSGNQPGPPRPPESGG